MAELADAQASGACGGNIVWVQVPFPAFQSYYSHRINDKVLHQARLYAELLEFIRM